MYRPPVLAAPAARLGVAERALDRMGELERLMAHRFHRAARILVTSQATKMARTIVQNIGYLSFGGHGFPPLCCQPVWHSGQEALRLASSNVPPRAALTLCAACMVSHEIHCQHFGLRRSSQRPSERSKSCRRTSVMCLRSAADLLCRRMALRRKRKFGRLEEATFASNPGELVRAGQVLVTPAQPVLLSCQLLCTAVCMSSHLPFSHFTQRYAGL
jgi:hypothetical protein